LIHLSWVVDGVVRRTVTKESTFNQTENNYRFPARPSYIQLSIWDAAQIDSSWTDNWSGGRIDWNDPNRKFTMEFEWIKINCLDPAKDTAWPPAGYKTLLTNNNTGGNGQDDNPTPQQNYTGYSSKSSIIVPIALAGGLFGGMVIIGYALSALARRKRGAKVDPGAVKPEVERNMVETA
jgi:hypothetical protein